MLSEGLYPASPPIDPVVSASLPVVLNVEAVSDVNSSLMMSSKRAAVCTCGPRSRTSCSDDGEVCAWAKIKPLNARAAKANKSMPAQDVAAASVAAVQGDRRLGLSAEEYTEAMKPFKPEDHVLARKRKLRITDDKGLKAPKPNKSGSGTLIYVAIFIVVHRRSIG